MSVVDYQFPDNCPLPPGYRVAWYSCHEHYQATGPDEWEGSISVDPYWCRAQAIHHAGTDEPLDPYCPICGETMEVIVCDRCHGAGGYHDCGDDTCACADPDDDLERCDECSGHGEHLQCSRVEYRPHTDEEMAVWRAKAKGGDQ